MADTLSVRSWTRTYSACNTSSIALAREVQKTHFSTCSGGRELRAKALQLYTELESTSVRDITALTKSRPEVEW
ncbi:hypothetical protein PHMEG_00027361 [Phytophthora megakarya]|uniref:Uncharacterized protein n=1 Tax=Phytophthora megakarya TaxID=4795 RepID=A0A225V922_9STRA|nr:hypothetical protein PHMEG_00027361 [Phytophthora megakarya]